MKNIPAPFFFAILALISLLSAFLIASGSGISLTPPSFFKANKQVAAEEEVKSPYLLALATPDKVKGIYLTGYTFSNNKRRTELVNLIEATELNSLVVDFKDPAGKLMVEPFSEKLKNWPLSPVALDHQDYQDILGSLQAKNIYTIARITAFQDPAAVKAFPDLALKNKAGGVWADYKGVTWLDMTNPGVWQLVAEETKEAALIGFDEVQFDYIRFPSDGNIKQIEYFDFKNGQKKHEIIAEFFKYLKADLKELAIPLSIDLFGLTYQRRNDPDYDLNIGQRLIDAAPYFDFISPMVYPSHYPKGFLSYSNPASHPYEVVRKAMSEGNFILESATSSIAQTRPWLQDFDLGADYNAPMIRAQIKAADENKTAGWLLWNARNVYTAGALEK
ncbi:MAG: putative glycoside hydrolase [Candidatus Buchananbacteria bacterium]|nr:putative glycoside hydrolase [Candidatus Buchananbacteria bacterium]